MRNLKPKKIYNPHTPEELMDRKVVGGDPDGILNFAKMRFDWARQVYDLMEANTWFPKEVNLTDDPKDYKSLSSSEKRMYDLALAHAIYLDSFQVNNIMDNFNRYITAPEVNACLSRQSYEETLHSKSYAVIAEALFDNPDIVYELWKNDPVLRQKNNDIYETFNLLETDDITDEIIFYAVIGNLLLEAVYFHVAFLCFYNLSRLGKMKGTSGMIRFINRDEVTHVLLFSNIAQTMLKSNPLLSSPKVKDNVITMLKRAYDIESRWGIYITNENGIEVIPGINNELIKTYVKHLINGVCRNILIEPLYPEVINPCEWVTQFSSFNEQRTNFFEGNVVNYSKGSTSFDDL